MVRPTRTTQPYRRAGGRHPGAALTAMLRGRAMNDMNVADIRRAAFMVGSPRKAHRWGQRPPRPARKQRPPRAPR